MHLFTLEVVEVRSGDDRLGAGQHRAQLKDGVFDLSRLGLELPGGDMEARARMQWRDSERLNAHVELDVDQLDYGVLARRRNPESTMNGMFSLFARLDADYVANRGLMSGASGAIVFGVWPEDFKSGIFDLWAIGLANALLPKLDTEKASRSIALLAASIWTAACWRNALFLPIPRESRLPARSMPNFSTRAARCATGAERQTGTDFFLCGTGYG